MNKITVEISYALKEKQYLQKITLDKDATVKQAIISSSILKIETDIDLKRNKVGIYSRLVELNDKIKDGDRIEIYRPLVINPQEIRHRRLIKHMTKRSSLLK